MKSESDSTRQPLEYSAFASKLMHDLYKVDAVVSATSALIDQAEHSEYDELDYSELVSQSTELLSDIRCKLEAVITLLDENSHYYTLKPANEPGAPVIEPELSPEDIELHALTDEFTDRIRAVRAKHREGAEATA